MTTGVTLMRFFLCLLLFTSLLWHLVVVPAVVAPCGGLCNRQITPSGSLGLLFVYGFGVPLQPFWCGGM